MGSIKQPAAAINEPEPVIEKQNSLYLESLSKLFANKPEAALPLKLYYKNRAKECLTDEDRERIFTKTSRIRPHFCAKCGNDERLMRLRIQRLTGKKKRNKKLAVRTCTFCKHVVKEAFEKPKDILEATPSKDGPAKKVREKKQKQGMTSTPESLNHLKALFKTASSSKKNLQKTGLLSFLSNTAN